MLNSVLPVNKSDQPAEIPCPGTPTTYVADLLLSKTAT